jgi:subtilisin family serine protease
MIKTSTMVALNGKNVNIIENSIENFLDNSSQSFDTIYLDTWEDGDPRYLAHVNYLVQLALKRLSKEGQIQCWGYFGMDYNGHGTHCAGIIAGTANNNKGISGIAPGVKLMPVRAGFSMKNNLGDEYGLLENDDIVNAIYYAVDSGADIISMSFGGPENLDVGIAIQYAASQGVILVAAAGNSGVTECSYPAAFNQVIAVAATGQNNDKAYYSNFGAWVDVAAPGGDKNLDSMILSTVLLRL